MESLNLEVLLSEDPTFRSEEERELLMDGKFVEIIKRHIKETEIVEKNSFLGIKWTSKKKVQEPLTEAQLRQIIMDNKLVHEGKTPDEALKEAVNEKYYPAYGSYYIFEEFQNGLGDKVYKFLVRHYSGFI